MHIADKTVLVTGANRGIGEALVKEALNRGVKRVFAGTRVALTNTDPRVTALTPSNHTCGRSIRFRMRQKRFPAHTFEM
jgi:NAD(P)-dependent dehydrogenase (short-subunit alcohol dehydrogenase family)